MLTNSTIEDLKKTGYTQIQKPQRQWDGDQAGREFEIIDMGVPSSTKITIGAPTPEKKKRARKKAPAQEVIPVSREEMPEDIKEPELTYHDCPPKTVKFRTDITEVEIEAMYVHIENEVICIFFDIESKMKIKPRKGTWLEVEIDGDSMDVYSPGISIPVPCMGMEIIFLLAGDRPEV
jgi:hypothetical protein